jgi:hypothetical protein
MQSTITRLALFQFLAVIYSILFVGLMVKIRFGSPAPEIFATLLRDYGFLLLFLPAAWLIWASVSANNPRPGAGDLSRIMDSGLTLLGLLILIAVIGTMSAILPGTLLVGRPPPPPAIEAQ